MYNPVKLAFIIISFNALKKKQYKKLTLLTGCKPFVLNNDSKTSANLTRIRESSFTHDKYLNSSGY